MLFSSQLQLVAVCYSRRVAVCCSLIFASFDVGGYYIEERIEEEKIIQDFWLELLSPQHLVLQMFVCIEVFIYIYVYMRMHKCAYMYIHTFMNSIYVHAYLHEHIYIYVHSYLRMYIYTYMYIHT